VRTRKLVVVGTALMLASTLAACGSGASADSEPTSSNSDSTAEASESIADMGDIDLTYWMWNASQEPTFREMADQFEEKYPNVTVNIELTPVSEYWTKLQTAVQGGDAPDVFWMNHLNLPLYADNGIVAPIDDALKPSGLSIDDYPDTVGLYNYNGAQYGLPQDLDTGGMWYNKQLFDEAGLDYPTADWTWDDVKSAAEVLTDESAGVYAIASSVDSQSNYYPTIWQAGGEILNEDLTSSGWDTPENKAGLEYWLDFIEAGQSPTVAQLAETPADQLFPSGKLAMYYSGTWNVAPYSKDPAIAEMVDVAPYPAGIEEATFLGSLTSAVNAKSPNLAAAKAFSLWTAGPEAAKIRVERQDKAPAHGDAWRDWAANSPFDLEGLYAENLETGRRLPASKNTPAWTKVEVDTVTQILAGQLPIDEGLAVIKEGTDKALAEEK
jgi:multiple sugar transport system substrate-binding protein